MSRRMILINREFTEIFEMQKNRKLKRFLNRYKRIPNYIYYNWDEPEPKPKMLTTELDFFKNLNHVNIFREECSFCGRTYSIQDLIKVYMNKILSTLSISLGKGSLLVFLITYDIITLKNYDLIEKLLYNCINQWNEENHLNITYRILPLNSIYIPWVLNLVDASIFNKYYFKMGETYHSKLYELIKDETVRKELISFDNQLHLKDDEFDHYYDIVYYNFKINNEYSECIVRKDRKYHVDIRVISNKLASELYSKQEEAELEELNKEVLGNYLEYLTITIPYISTRDQRNKRLSKKSRKKIKKEHEEQKKIAA